jgi:hypothetical protein
VDVIGGLVVGATAVAIARMALPAEGAGIATSTVGARTALRVSLLAVVALAALYGAGLDAHEAGRFCGLVGAALLLLRKRAFDDSVPFLARLARTAAALVLLGIAVWSSTWTIGTGPGLAVVSRMAISAALHASVLLLPAVAFGGHRS